MENSCRRPERHAGQGSERAGRKGPRQEVGLEYCDPPAALVPGQVPQMGDPHGVDFNSHHFGPAGHQGSAQCARAGANIYDQFAGRDPGLGYKPVSGRPA